MITLGTILGGAATALGAAAAGYGLYRAATDKDVVRTKKKLPFIPVVIQQTLPVWRPTVVEAAGLISPTPGLEGAILEASRAAAGGGAPPGGAAAKAVVKIGSAKLVPIPDPPPQVPGNRVNLDTGLPTKCQTGWLQSRAPFHYSQLKRWAPERECTFPGSAGCPTGCRTDDKGPMTYVGPNYDKKRSPSAAFWRGWGWSQNISGVDGGIPPNVLIGGGMDALGTTLLALGWGVIVGAVAGATGGLSAPLIFAAGTTTASITAGIGKALNDAQKAKLDPTQIVKGVKDIVSGVDKYLLDAKYWESLGFGE